MRKTIFILCVFFTFIGSGCAQKEKPAIVIGDVDISAKEFEEAFDAACDVFFFVNLAESLAEREAKTEDVPVSDASIASS